MYRAGVDTFALQQLLGHPDVKATTVYAGVTRSSPRESQACTRCDLRLGSSPQPIALPPAAVLGRPSLCLRSEILPDLLAYAARIALFNLNVR